MPSSGRGGKRCEQPALRTSPSLRPDSNARLTDSFAAITAICEKSLMVSAAPRAFVHEFVQRHHAADQPGPLGLGGVHHAAGEAMSMALALPTARGRRWVPPAPGMMPSLISGWPNGVVRRR